MTPNSDCLTNTSKDNQHSFACAGFIIAEPQGTDTYTSDQLAEMGMIGVYSNPLKPDAVFPNVIGRYTDRW